MTPLPATLSPRETTAVLSATVREVHGADARLERWTASPISKRGKGRTVRYDLAAREAPSRLHHHQWVGKFYERDDVARRVASLLRRLAESGCGARGRFVLPAVVGYYAPCRLLFLTHEAGESVVAAIARDPALVLSAIGRALAALHTAPVEPDTIISTGPLLARLWQEIGDLTARFPSETDSLRRVLIQLERQAPLGPFPPCLLHGALGPAQLRWRTGNVIFLDLDDCTRGDPALDLGNLLAQLRRLTLRKPAKLPDFASLRLGILGAYQRASPYDPGLALRVSWYERIKLVRKIHFLTFDTTRHAQAEAGLRRRAEATRLLHELPLLANSDGSATGSSPVVLDRGG